MRISDNAKEVKRFVRAAKDAFAGRTSEAGFTLTFALGIAKPLEGVSDSVINSTLEKILRAANAFGPDDLLVADLNIIDQDGFEHQLVNATRSNYEASQKLEAAPKQAAKESSQPSIVPISK